MTPSTQGSSTTAFAGTDNLEVMREAVNYNRYLLGLIRRHAGLAKRVIDFGAGSGTFAVPSAAAGLDVTAVELDDDLRARLASFGLKVSASTAELSRDSFEFAYTFNVLEHIPDDVEALRGLFATLVPGAHLLVYVPAFPVLYTSMDEQVGHLRRYTRSTLIRSVTAAGFSVESVRYADSLGFLGTLAFKLVDRGAGNINRSMLRIYDRVVFPMSRALDLVTHRVVGKNLVLVARKPD